MTKKILWLPSWYPNKLSPYDGDFIQRHARAVSLFQKIFVLYVKKDEKGIIAKGTSEQFFSAGNLDEKIIYYHLRKTGIKTLDRFLSARKSKGLYRKTIKDFINENGRPDLVHLHVAVKTASHALWLKRIYSIPFIISEHWTGYLPKAQQGIKNMNVFQKFFLQKAFADAIKVTVVSDVLGKAIANRFDRQNYQVIPNAVDTSIFFPVKHKENSAVKFIVIAAYVYQKNIDGIIDALSLLSERTSNFNVSFFGYFPDSFRKKVMNKNLHPLIRFEGEVSQLTLATHLKTSDALILYSHYETFGCVVIEANACGVPAVLSDLPVFEEFVTETENGIFVAPDNPHELAKTLERFIDGKYSFNAHLIAQHTASKFSFQTVGEQFFQLYTDVLNADE